jgi:uncharacterized phage protein (TIGR02218 family)
MRDIPVSLAGHLASGTTTLANCWRLTRTDGAVLGFTDHDRDLAFDGCEFRARSGLEAAEAVGETSLAVAGGEVTGALSAEGLDEAGLEAGLFDGARVETFLVNWADPAMRIKLAEATIGEVTRRDGAFTAELRSAAHRLNQVGGRSFGKTCDADLGDRRCGVDLAALAEAGVVVSSDGRMRLSASGLEAGAGRFTAGLLTWTSGANRGGAVEVKRHEGGTDQALLELWQPTAEAIAAGDGFTVTPGCDKSFSTCRDRFANAVRFRGFPHIPGNDRVLAYARPGERHDGRSLSGGG